MRRLLLLALLATSAAFAQSPEQAVRYAKLRTEAEAAFRLNQFPKVVELLGEAVTIYDRDGDVWWRYGQSLLNQKQHKESIAALEKALQCGGFGNKMPAGAHYDIACNYALMGDVENGIQHLQKAMDLGFRDLDHMRSDTDLEGLRKDKRYTKIAMLADVAKMSRDEGWRYDLALMDREVRRKHFSPYTRHSKKEFDDYVSKLNKDIPKLTDNQVRAGFVRYMAMFADGHTATRPANGAPEGQHIPLQPFWFKEGIFLTLVGPGNEDLAGAQVLKVGGKKVEEVLEMARPYTSYENEQGYKSASMGWLVRPAWLNAVGLAQKDDEATYTVRDAKGVEREVTLKKSRLQASAEWTNARSASGNPDPLYMKKRTTPFWMEVLPERKMLYFQYNSVANMQGETTAQFADKLGKELAGDIDTLVVDVRWNGGGNSFLNKPLIQTILRSKQNKKGSLFLITGRNTYSACQNFSTDIWRDGEAIFVGEPTGSSPNFIGESVRSTLPYGKMTLSVSDLYWQRSWPMDHRNWIAPELPAEPTFAVFKENRDPAMEAIAAFLAAKG